MRPTSPSTRHLLLAAAVVAITTATARAAAPRPASLRIDQFSHTAWTSKDGAPTGITAITQDATGYLWLGSSDGFFRFDGHSFVAVTSMGGEKLPHELVARLAADRDGGLWIGYQESAGLLYVKDGVVTHVRLGAGRTTVGGLLVDPRGIVWASANHQLWRIDGLRANRVDAAWGLPQRTVSNTTLDPQGRVCAGVEQPGELFCLDAGGRRFTSAGTIAGGDFHWGTDGSLWLLNVYSMTRVRHGAGKGGGLDTVHIDPAGDAVTTPDGALWSTRLDGITRSADIAELFDRRGQHGAGETFTPAKGLTSTVIRTLFVDRDGNVWAGTGAGLDRFRRTPITPVALARRPQPATMAPAQGDAIWAATFDGALMRVTPPGSHDDHPAAGPRLFQLLRDRDGGLWAGGTPDIWHLDAAGHAVKLPRPFAADNRTVMALAHDGDGTLWAGYFGERVTWRFSDGSWRAAGAADGFTRPGSAIAMAVDDAGRVWQSLGTTVLLVEHGHARELPEAPGIGEVNTLYVHGRHVWLGGADGVVLFDGRRFTRLQRRDGAPLSAVGGIVERAGGDVWLHEKNDALRIPAAQLKDAGRTATLLVDVDTLDATDGLPGNSNLPHPNLVEADDGKLWFAAPSGLAWLDPDRLPAKRAPAPVRILALDADGKSYPLRGSPALAALNQRTELAFTAVDLSTPERQRFRYRLDGVNRDWQDAGAARSAIYANLAPGGYVFHVRTRDERGAWRDEGADLAFSVLPAWWQTAWFRALYLLAGGLAAWTLHRMRARQLTRQALVREQVRQSERDRIARELHDTLLQGTQGLVLNLQVVAGELPRDDARRQRIQSLLDGADGMIAEVRDRVFGLRQAEDAHRPLFPDLARLGSELAHSTSIRFEPRQAIELPALPADLARELFLIGREALTNAFRHSGASRIELAVEREAGLALLIVADDGVGIASEVLAAGARPGHWGLVGMRERASRIGAALVVAQGRDGGTRVEIRFAEPARAGRVRASIATARARWRR